MPLYECKCCNFSTRLKGDYNRHLATKKHKKIISIRNKVCNSETPKNEHKMNTNEHKMNTNEHKMNTNQILKNTNFVCKYCNMTFNTKPSMRRHQIHYCKSIQKESDDSELNMHLQNQLKKEKIEKKILYKQIETLLEDNGKIINNFNNTLNTTNNIQQHNNIVINNYGEEDMSHITNQVLDKLINAPADMINNLTKMIHFNNNKPENMNMYIPSRKQKFIKVFRKNKWMLEKKHERIPDLVDRNYNIIDSYYEDQGGSEKLDKEARKNYQQYQKLIDDRNEKIIKNEFDSCELEILNNSEKVMDQHKLTH